MGRVNTKINLPTIIFVIFWDFSMFYQIFLSPQVKRCVIIIYKHGIYELSHEFPNDLRNISKLSKLHRMIAQCPNPRQNESFCQYWKKTLEKGKCCAPFHTKTRVSLKYPVSHCSYRQIKAKFLKVFSSQISRFWYLPMWNRIYFGNLELSWLFRPWTISLKQLQIVPWLKKRMLLYIKCWIQGFRTSKPIFFRMCFLSVATYCLT